jgi:N-acetylneuraminic acid mutarotase
MYIFGGSEEGRKVISINDNFYKLDLDIYKWEKIKAELHPSLARECHSATIVNNYMYVFGGINCQTLFDDLWCFNFNTDTWKKIDVKLKPKARHSTTLINHQNRYLFLFGGIDADNIVCSSSFLFDLTENKWS